MDMWDICFMLVFFAIWAFGKSRNKRTRPRNTAKLRDIQQRISVRMPKLDPSIASGDIDSMLHRETYAAEDRTTRDMTRAKEKAAYIKEAELPDYDGEVRADTEGVMITPSTMQQAVIYAEILGQPKASHSPYYRRKLS